MSFLKEILVELENCVQDESSVGMPVVWSREIQRKLQNIDHWDKVGQNKGLLDVNDEEEEYGRYQDMERDATNNLDDPARDDYAGFANDIAGDQDQYPYDDEDEGDEWSDRRAEMDAETDTEDDYSDDDMSDDEWEDIFGVRPEEQEESPAIQPSVTKWTQKYLAKNAREQGDCESCFGTGDQFPGMETDCEVCGGSGEAQDRANTPVSFKDYVADEEQEEDEGGMPRREENPDETSPENQAVDDQYGLDDPNDETTEFDDAAGIGDEEPQEWDDPDYQGVIRTVPNAHMVSKRQQEDGTFNELWQYNLGKDFKQELEVRRGILAGTDIPINKMRSPDNTQNYELWTVGNGQLLKITGLPN